MLSKPLASLFALDRVSVRWARNGRCYNSPVIRMPPILKMPANVYQAGLHSVVVGAGEEEVQMQDADEQLIIGSHSEHIAG